MPARTTRQEARARILGAFTAQLDRMIPEDESVPLKGATFADFEDQAGALAGQLKDALWDGQLDQVIATLKVHAERVGPPQACDGPDHPRRVLANNVDYFQTHRHHMDYPTFRRKGWPIGSGVTESAVKQFNKRVKGTEQFWSVPGVEAILSLRALWLSQDGRWERFLRGSGQDWNTRPAYSKAA